MKIYIILYYFKLRRYAHTFSTWIMKYTTTYTQLHYSFDLFLSQQSFSLLSPLQQPRPKIQRASLLLPVPFIYIPSLSLSQNLLTLSYFFFFASPRFFREKGEIYKLIENVTSHFKVVFFYLFVKKKKFETYILRLHCIGKKTINIVKYSRVYEMCVFRCAIGKS